MTEQRELDRMLASFFVDGSNELPDRVIDGALDQIDHTRQRRPLRVPRRFSTMPMFTRVAAAAVIGVLAVGGTLYLIQPGPSSVGTSGATPGAGASPSQPGPTLAPSPSPQALTGPIGDGRQIHTGTLLADGRVLVAGGYAFGDGPLASATLYDPTTDTFSPTGSMADARGAYSATLLSDGRILVAGGGIAGWVFTGSYLSSAELYDPTTGSFSATGSMATPREAHTATRLSDGRVLIVGGVDTQTSSLASAELYDPTSGTFTPTGSMSAPRAWHTATLLSDGRVLITGGSPAAWSSNPALASAEVYDPTTGTFSSSGTMTAGREWHTATRLDDGRVLVTGGNDGLASDLASAEIYDPASNTFTATARMADPRSYHTATLLPDGRVLVAGGGGDYTNRSSFLASAELYDPTTGTFSSTGSLASARTNQVATRLADGRVLVTGGYGATAPLASAEIYDPNTGTFNPGGVGR